MSRSKQTGKLYVLMPITKQGKAYSSAGTIHVALQIGQKLHSYNKVWTDGH